MSPADILNFLPISDRLGTAGQPTREQFKALREAGYETVINLAPSDAGNALADEAGAVTGNGMRYVHIPVAWDNPTLEDLQRFFAAMDESDGRKVFVHCAMNLRVSSFVYLYRVLRLQEPEPEAAVALNEIWSRTAAAAKARGPGSTAAIAAASFYESRGVWRRFIEEALASANWC